jgi:hypothetical protein
MCIYCRLPEKEEGMDNNKWLNLLDKLNQFDEFMNPIMRIFNITVSILVLIILISAIGFTIELIPILLITGFFILMFKVKSESNRRRALESRQQLTDLLQGNTEHSPASKQTGLAVISYMIFGVAALILMNLDNLDTAGLLICFILAGLSVASIELFMKERVKGKAALFLAIMLLGGAILIIGHLLTFW